MAHGHSDARSPAGRTFPMPTPRGLPYPAAHRAEAPFELAAVSTDAAEAIILAGGAPVMAKGGFTGDDQMLPLDDSAYP